MVTFESLQAEILREWQGIDTQSAEELLRFVRQGQVSQALDNLLFFTPPSEFPEILDRLVRALVAKFPSAEQVEQRSMLEFSSELAARLASYLPRWNLLDASRHGRSALLLGEIETWACRARTLASQLALQQPGVASSYLRDRMAEIAVRFKAEATPHAGAASAAWVGTSIEHYLDSFHRDIEGSNLRRIADLRAEGHTSSEVSNDYAAFLPYTMHLGVSFVTCNPPLVDIAWQADPLRWNSVADKLVIKEPKATSEDLARRMTLEVVLSNMRQLRPIFLLTAGQTGCVSLQVNPKRHDDLESMIQDATAIYHELRKRLDGGVPNVVFKLPATRAGLQACAALTSEGIGVNITVNFGLFQHLRFAKEIQKGHALFSVLSHMSGRLAFPVRDELLGKLAHIGADESAARQAAAWSGIIVLKRLHRLLVAKGFDLARIKPLIASMRIYEGEMYRGLPTPIPDISEVIGTGILTVFPNVRRAFDALSGIPLNPRQIDAPPPAGVLPILAHSEIFRQAYYVSDPDWGSDDREFRPEHVLDLDDQAATVDWLPVRNTLNEFCKAYDQFVERIEGRRRLLELRLRLQSRTLWTSTDGASLTGALLHFDIHTVKETLEMLCATQASEPIAAVLRSPEICQALQSRGDDTLEAMRGRALARHSP